MKTTYIGYQLIVTRGNFTLLKRDIVAHTDKEAIEQAEEIALFYNQGRTMTQLLKAGKKRTAQIMANIKLVDQLFRVGDVTFTLTRHETANKKAKLVKTV